MNSIEVSDHAIVRYFERIIGFDIDELKNTILTGEFERVVRNNKVITIYPYNTKFKPKTMPKKVVDIREKGKRQDRLRSNSDFLNECL